MYYATYGREAEAPAPGLPSAPQRRAGRCLMVGVLAVTTPALVTED